MSETRCIIEGCDRAAKARGLCCSCHVFAARMVADDRCTWELLEQHGLANRPKRGRGSHNAFSDAFERLIQELGK